MIEEHYILDGELYLPGKSVNEINHFVKDPNCFENKLIQYWCYDVAIEDMSQYNRIVTLRDNFELFFTRFNTKEAHLANINRLVMLETEPILNGEDATKYRDEFIDLGFEGLILRNPDADYQFGKRNQSMIKYKRATDGKFVIVDIVPEGYKRPDIPLLICKNDINDKVFEVHLSSSLDFQRNVLKNKHKYIGKTLFITYGERSGVHSLPFHVKKVEFID
jgi:DNA ligase-1